MDQPAACVSSVSWPDLPAAVMAETVERAEDGILVADIREPGQPIIYVNAAFESITGYSRSEVLGQNCRYLQGTDRQQPAIAAMREMIERCYQGTVTLRNYRKDGRPFWNAVRLVPIRCGALEATHYIGFIRDVTDRHEAALRFDHVANFDGLTSILNRNAFVHALAALTRYRRILVAKIGVANLHDMNAGYGYEVGDALLVQIAGRLGGIGAQLIARVGGDKFGVAFAIEDAGTARDAIKRVEDALKERWLLRNAAVPARFAVGFVVGPPGAHALTLFRQAGSALFQSRAAPYPQTVEFDAEWDWLARDRVRRTAQCQQALASDDYVYHFQPQVDLATGEIVGSEALLRCRNAMPEPSEGFAAQTGLLPDIGVKGLRRVAEVARSVNHRRRKPLRFSLNIAGGEFTSTDFVTHAAEAVRATGADPSWLTLELAENLLVEGSGEMLRICAGLRDLGIGLAIDEFGTGCSSLRCLEAFPLTQIKVAPGFVAELAQSATKRIIMRSIVQIATELRMDVVAEGVTSRREASLLRAMKCSTVQGSLFCQPVEAEAFTVLARDGLPAERRPEHCTERSGSHSA